MSSHIAQESSPRPLTSGAVMAAASRIGVTVVGAATTVVVARVLGPRDWGTFAIAQSFVAILVAGTTLGVEHGIAYFVGSRQWAARAALAASVRFAGIVGTTGAAVGLGVRVVAPSAFSGLPVWATAVAALGVPFAIARLFMSYLALATDRYELSMSIPVAHAVLLLALALPLAATVGVTGAVVGMTAATVLAGIGAVGMCTLRLGERASSAAGQLRQAVSFGVKGYVANALQLVNYRLDLFILAAVATGRDVGCYALAIAATSQLWVLPGALSDVLYPRVANLSVRGDDASREMVETKSLRLVGLASIVGVVGMTAALELLVVPVFGERFRPAVNLGLILLPGAAAIGASSVLAATVVGRGRPKHSLHIALVTTPVSVVLFATLIPWLHASGAALASSLSYLLTFTLFCVFYGRVTGRNAFLLLVPSKAEMHDLRRLPRGIRRRFQS